MSNALYSKAKEGFLDGSISWTANDIRAVLIDNSAYTVNLLSHSYLSDVPAGARIATSGNLANKTATLGVADADDVTFVAVSGVQSESIVLYKHTGTESTSTLIAYIDTSTGLPVTPNGEDIVIIWDAGAYKIFGL
jgi:hypothetical protein